MALDDLLALAARYAAEGGTRGTRAEEGTRSRSHDAKSEEIRGFRKAGTPRTRGTHGFDGGEATAEVLGEAAEGERGEFGEPLTPCAECGAGQWWRLARIDPGFTGNWWCAGCSPPPADRCCDAAVLPVSCATQ